MIRKTNAMQKHTQEPFALSFTALNRSLRPQQSIKLKQLKVEQYNVNIGGRIENLKRLREFRYQGSFQLTRDRIFDVA